MKARKWNTEEHEFLMEQAHRIPWDVIASKLGRSEAACKAKFEKLKKLRQFNGTWGGI